MGFEGHVEIYTISDCNRLKSSLLRAHCQGILSIKDTLHELGLMFTMLPEYHYAILEYKDMQVC